MGKTKGLLVITSRERGYTVPRDQDMSPGSSAGEPKLRFYDEDQSPRSITAAFMPWSLTPLALPPTLVQPSSGVIQEEEEGGVHESGGKEASDEEFEEEWDRAWFEERPWPVPYTSGSLTSNDHVKFVAMCERKRRSSRKLADDLDGMSRAGRHPLTYLLILAAALLLLAAVMPMSHGHGHPPSPPIKPKAARFQPLWMHYEFDPDMFDNFWFPLFI